MLKLYEDIHRIDKSCCFFPQLFFSKASSSASPAFVKASPMLSQQSQLLPEHRTVGFAKSWHIVAQLINQALRTPEKSINVSYDSYFLSSVNMAFSRSKCLLLGSLDRDKVGEEMVPPFFCEGGPLSAWLPK